MTYRYPTVKVNGKTKLKHRHLVEQRLGRALSTDEHVHHKDEDAFNTAPDNLEPLPAEVHRQHHADERLIYPRTKPCAVCGTVFTPKPSKRKRQKTCGKAECANTLRSRTEKATKANMMASNQERYADAAE